MLSSRLAPFLAAAALLLVGNVIVLAAGSGPEPEPAGAESIEAGAAATPQRAVLELRKTRFGRVIHERSSGLVAYLFSRDRRGRSSCHGACAKAWPPVKTRRRPVAGAGLKQRRLGVIRRPGGAKMVSYRGRALYFYEHDSPGVVLCHDVREFGGRWFVVKRSGRPA